MKKRFSISIAIMFACGVHLHAQHFRWEASVNPVGTEGYTRILLSPEVTGQTRDPFLDIRIYDNDSVQVPFLGVYDKIVKGTDRFVEYPITDKSDRPDNCWITVMNPLSISDKLGHLVLEVNNTDASRRMTLTGSYDNNTWFAIKDEFTTTYYETYDNGVEKTSNLVRFDFPLSDYRYYRFSFDNWSEWWQNYQAPVFVARAGIMVPVNAGSIKDNLVEVPGVTITQSENAQLKMTEVDVVFTDSQFVDYLRFELIPSNPSGKFHRGARLYVLSVDSTSLGKETPMQTLLSSIVLSSHGLNELPVYGFKVKHLLLRIVNEDDAPLHIQAVHALQVKRYLLAYLEPGINYVVRFGNDSLQWPQYDLRYLGDSLAMHEMPVITVGPRKRLPDPPSPKIDPGVNSIFQDKRAIWGAIIIVILVLGWMSAKMLREMK